jgi:hypothetical protein
VVRLLGVGASRLSGDGPQRDLFEDGDHQRQEALDQAVDAIRDQFGTAAIRRSSLLERPDPGDG